MSSEDRIIELEIKAAYQEDLLQDLNQIVITHQQQIERLERICRLLNERMQSLMAESGRGGEPSGQEIPPHY